MSRERGAAKRAQVVGGEEIPWRRLIKERKKTLLNRNWHAVEACSSSVALARTIVTGPRAQIVAVRLAPCT